MIEISEIVGDIDISEEYFDNLLGDFEYWTKEKEREKEFLNAIVEDLEELDARIADLIMMEESAKFLELKVSELTKKMTKGKNVRSNVLGILNNMLKLTRSRLISVKVDISDLKTEIRFKYVVFLCLKRWKKETGREHIDYRIVSHDRLSQLDRLQMIKDDDVYLWGSDGIPTYVGRPIKVEKIDKPTQDDKQTRDSALNG